MLQTPTFEYFDVYNVTTPTQAEHMFKFFDTNGRMLALRPDITTSIARMAATKPNAGELPMRLSYLGSAFRNEENFSQARQREFTQVGVEPVSYTHLDVYKRQVPTISKCASSSVPMSVSSAFVMLSGIEYL